MQIWNQMRLLLPHWRIQGGAPAPPPLTDKIFLNFMHFFGKILQICMLAHPGGLAPPSIGYPGSAPVPANEVWGKVMFLLVCDILLTGGRGSLYNVTSCLAAWSYVPSEGSLFLVPYSFWGSCLWYHVPYGGSWTETPLDRDPSGRAPPPTETPWTETAPRQRPPCMVKSGW